MSHQDILTRINELAAKAKSGELSEAEKKEQAELRQAYVQEFRASFKNQIENIKVFDEDGNELTPDKVKDIQEKRHLFQDNDQA